MEPNDSKVVVSTGDVLIRIKVERFLKVFGIGGFFFFIYIVSGICMIVLDLDPTLRLPFLSPRAGNIVMNIFGGFSIIAAFVVLAFCIFIAKQISEPTPKEVETYRKRIEQERMKYGEKGKWPGVQKALKELFRYELPSAIKVRLPTFVVERIEIGELTDEQRMEYVRKNKHFILARKQDIEKFYNTPLNVSELVAGLELKKRREFNEETINQTQQVINRAAEELWKQLVLAETLIDPVQKDVEEYKRWIQSVDKEFEMHTEREKYIESINKKYILKYGKDEGSKMFERFLSVLHEKELWKDEEYKTE
jgi:hypothetical protein